MRSKHLPLPQVVPRTPESITAVVAAVVTAVKNGKEPYVVAFPEYNIGDLTTKMSITFALSVWADRFEPHAGQVVRLKNIQRFARGWRAMSAEPVAFESNSNKQKKGVHNV